MNYKWYDYNVLIFLFYFMYFNFEEFKIYYDEYLINYVF